MMQDIWVKNCVIFPSPSYQNRIADTQFVALNQRSKISSNFGYPCLWCRYLGFFSSFIENRTIWRWIASQSQIWRDFDFNNNTSYQRNSTKWCGCHQTSPTTGLLTGSMRFRKINSSANPSKLMTINPARKLQKRNNNRWISTSQKFGSFELKFWRETGLMESSRSGYGHRDADFMTLALDNR